MQPVLKTPGERGRLLMLIREIFVCLLGLIFGGSVAAGVVALISSLGIFPRIIGKSTAAGHILLLENCLIAGAALGCLLAIFEFDLGFWGGWFLVFAGIFVGIFVGCLAAALAEVIQIWPVMYRRMKAKYGLSIAMTCFAFGKLAGALYYFLLLKYQV